jgi:hypothetical protein
VYFGALWYVIVPTTISGWLGSACLVSRRQRLSRNGAKQEGQVGTEASPIWSRIPVVYLLYTKSTIRGSKIEPPR